MKKNEDELELALQPMAWHGVEFTGISGGQRYGTCPCCGKPKFYASRKKGLWDCKVCAASGNPQQFLAWVFKEVYRPACTAAERKAFATFYKLPLSALNGVELGFGPRGYVFPIRDARGRIVNLRTRRLGKKVVGTKGIGGADLGCWGLDEASKAPRTVPRYITEGESDRLAVRDKLRQLNKPGVVVSVPGVSSFRPEWVRSFTGCPVFVLFDNDEAGAQGDALLYRLLHPVAATLKFLRWPDRSALRGCDVRDYLTTGGTWKRLSSWFSVEPRRQPDSDALDDLRPEPFGAFADRLANTPRKPDLIAQLVPGEGITLVHSQPRGLKTWVSSECQIAIATGTPAFGAAEYSVETPRSVWYLTEEDPPVKILERLRALLAGRGLTEAPDRLLLSVKQGWNLDDPDHQGRLLHFLQSQRIEVLIIDPLRSVTGATDKTYVELRPFILFLRRLQRETGVVLILTHHDTKPQPGTIDTREGPQRMSGGGLFSVVDAPIHLTKLTSEGGPACLLAPSDYKFGEAPPPVKLRLVTDHPRTATRATWVTTPATAGSERALEHDDQLLRYFREHAAQEFSGRQLATALRMGQGTVRLSLQRLLAAGQVEKRTGSGTEKNAQLWRLAKAAVQPGASATSRRRR